MSRRGARYLSPHWFRSVRCARTRLHRGARRALVELGEEQASQREFLAKAMADIAARLPRWRARGRPRAAHARARQGARALALGHRRPRRGRHGAELRCAPRRAQFFWRALQTRSPSAGLTRPRWRFRSDVGGCTAGRRRRLPATSPAVADCAPMVAFFAMLGIIDTVLARRWLPLFVCTVVNKIFVTKDVVAPMWPSPLYRVVRWPPARAAALPIYSRRPAILDNLVWVRRGLPDMLWQICFGLTGI